MDYEKLKASLFFKGGLIFIFLGLIIDPIGPNKWVAGTIGFIFLIISIIIEIKR
jgi:hypothetical protein